MRTSLALFFTCVLCANALCITVHYVDLNSTNPVSAYTDWSTAATNIQDAVRFCQSGDTVLVTNGVYSYGGVWNIFLGAGAVTNRVALTNAITVSSVNGPEVTVIAGGPSARYPTRCAYLGDNAVLSGFTLTNGVGGDGGGAFCTPTSIITNCVITGCQGEGVYRGAIYNSLLVGNTTTSQGAGAWSSTLYNCILSNNYAYGPHSFGGGGAYNCTLHNCLLVSNSTTWQGGGAASSSLYNCTVIGNSATNAGGGLYGSHTYGSIIYFNSGSSTPNMILGDSAYCCTPLQLAPGLDYPITNDPGFVDLERGDFHLQSTSPCINAGNNAYAVGTNDLDGNLRIVGGTVDIGAYEYQNPTSLISYAWLQQYGFPTDGSADFADPDHDGMNNWQEWIAGTYPTNALSVLRIVSATNTTTGAAVSWQSVNTRSYFVQRASDLGGQPAFRTVATNIAGLNSTTTFTDTNAPGVGPSLYRVGVHE